jgi:hypothetical protein
MSKLVHVPRWLLRFVTVLLLLCGTTIPFAKIASAWHGFAKAVATCYGWSIDTSAEPSNTAIWKFEPSSVLTWSDSNEGPFSFGGTVYKPDNCTPPTTTMKPPPPTTTLPPTTTTAAPTTTTTVAPATTTTVAPTTPTTVVVTTPPTKPVVTTPPTKPVVTTPPTKPVVTTPPTTPATSPPAVVHPPHDVCRNIHGTQTQVPPGKVQTKKGNCITPPQKQTAPPATKPVVANTDGGPMGSSGPALLALAAVLAIMIAFVLNRPRAAVTETDESTD